MNVTDQVIALLSHRNLFAFNPPESSWATHPLNTELVENGYRALTLLDPRTPQDCERMHISCYLEKDGPRIFPWIACPNQVIDSCNLLQELVYRTRTDFPTASRGVDPVSVAIWRGICNVWGFQRNSPTASSQRGLPYFQFKPGREPVIFLREHEAFSFHVSPLSPLQYQY